MSHNLEIVVLDPKKGTGPTPLCLPPIPRSDVSDFNQLKTYVDEKSKNRSFIVLIMDLHDSNSRPMLEKLKEQDHLYAIFVCVKPNCRLQYNGGKIYPVAKKLITLRITLSAIRFFECSAERLLRSNQLVRAFTCKQTANALNYQLQNQVSIKGSHILLTPLNTDDNNLIDCQQRLIDQCNDICRGGDYEPIVSTIYDYIPYTPNSDFNQDEDIYVICNFVKRITPIRMYLPGNEQSISNLSSKILFNIESHDINEGHYDDKYTLIENIPLIESIKSNLPKIFGWGGQSTNIIPARLDTIETAQLLSALDRANCVLPNVEMIANIDLINEVMRDTVNVFEYSSLIRINQQPENNPPDQSENTDEEINNQIQCLK